MVPLPGLGTPGCSHELGTVSPSTYLWASGCGQTFQGEPPGLKPLRPSCYPGLLGLMESWEQTGMTASFYLAASDCLSQIRLGASAQAGGRDPTLCYQTTPGATHTPMHNPSVQSPILLKSSKTIGPQGPQCKQRSLSKRSSSPKVRAQQDPAPFRGGWGCGDLGGVQPQTPEFLLIGKGPPFPLRPQPIQFCSGWFYNLPSWSHPAIGSSQAGLHPGPRGPSVPGQECW